MSEGKVCNVAFIWFWVEHEHDTLHACNQVTMSQYNTLKHIDIGKYLRDLEGIIFHNPLSYNSSPFSDLTLGVPVEPDVYITIAVSSGVGEAVVVSPLTSTGIDESMFAP